MRTLFLCLSLFFFSATSTTNDLVGVWVITTPDENGDPIKWEMTFTADGAYSVDVLIDGSIDIHGKYWIDGKQITFQNNEECGCCDDKGLYKFWIENDKLWVDPIEDNCKLRKPPHKVYFTKA